MTADYFRRLDIPFFNDALLGDFANDIIPRLDRRFFDWCHRGVFGINILPSSFYPLSEFTFDSKIRIDPIFFLCINPGRVTNRLVNDLRHLDDFCLLHVPLLPLNRELPFLRYYESEFSIDPMCVAYTIPGKSLLFNSFSKPYDIINDDNEWRVVLEMRFHARYDLVSDLIDRGQLFDKNLISFAKD